MRTCHNRLKQDCGEYSTMFDANDDNFIVWFMNWRLNALLIIVYGNFFWQCFPGTPSPTLSPKYWCFMINERLAWPICNSNDSWSHFWPHNFEHPIWNEHQINIKIKWRANLSCLKSDENRCVRVTANKIQWHSRKFAANLFIFHCDFYQIRYFAQLSYFYPKYLNKILHFSQQRRNQFV